MSEVDWNFPDGRFLAYILGAVVEQGEPLLIVLNGAEEPSTSSARDGRRSRGGLHHRHRERAIEFHNP